MLEAGEGASDAEASMALMVKKESQAIENSMLFCLELGWDWMFWSVQVEMECGWKWKVSRGSYVQWSCAVRLITEAAAD